MPNLTLAYSNHRPETVELTAQLMDKHEVIILEEPPHPDFYDMLDRTVDLEAYLLEQEFEYQLFSRRQSSVLQDFAARGKKIIQSDPFLQHLFEIQSFFAEGNGPNDLEPDTILYRIYLREKEATRRLIDYYRAVRQNDFLTIIDVMKRFAQADAERIKLRDCLRAGDILASLSDDKHTCVEAGPMHLHLGRYLRSQLPPGWVLKTWFAEHQAMGQLGLQGTFYGPGDVLTMYYLFNRSVPASHENLLCARALIFNKIVKKEEEIPGVLPFPHLAHECRIIKLLSTMSYKTCKHLFFTIRDLAGEEALAVVARHAKTIPPGLDRN